MGRGHRSLPIGVASAICVVLGACGPDVTVTGPTPSADRSTPRTDQASPTSSAPARSTQPTPSQPSSPPAHHLPRGALTEGGIDAFPGKHTSSVPRVDVYLDFQCPFCRKLEMTNGHAMAASARHGQIRLIYHFATFLDREGDASSRAANAADCAADAKRLTAYVHTTLRHQRGEDAGYSDRQLISFGRDVEVPEQHDFADCVKSRTHRRFVQTTAEGAQQDVSAVPTVTIDGTPITTAQMSDLQKRKGSWPEVLSEAS